MPSLNIHSIGMGGGLGALLGAMPPGVLEEAFKEFQAERSAKSKQKRAELLEQIGDRAAWSVEIEVGLKGGESHARQFLFTDQKDFQAFRENLPKMTAQGLLVLGNVQTLSEKIDEEPVVYQAFPAASVISIQIPATP